MNFCAQVEAADLEEPGAGGWTWRRWQLAAGLARGPAARVAARAAGLEDHP